MSSTRDASRFAGRPMDPDLASRRSPIVVTLLTLHRQADLAHMGTRMNRPALQDGEAIAERFFGEVFLRDRFMLLQPLFRRQRDKSGHQLLVDLRPRTP